jgi:hypothetical protein
MTRDYNEEQRNHASRASLASYHDHFRGQLERCGFDVQEVEFSEQKARHREGMELVAKLRCPEGHDLALTLRDVDENLGNKFFNDASVVPHLCEKCAYPGTTPTQKKSTVYHRLAILRTIYPRARHIQGFDPSGKSWESYGCGEAHVDGTAHAPFFVRFDKLVKGQKEGTLRHVCYECGIKAGQTPETKVKTLPMLAGRMKLIADAIAARTGAIVNPSVTLAEGQSFEPGDIESQVTTTSTQLVFSCGIHDHAAVTRTADSYFNVAKGGFCKACLKNAGIKTVTALFD